MSAEFDLVSIGALLQLWIFTIATFESVCCFTLCCLRQRLNLVLSSVSMRLRLKRFVGFSYFLSKLKSFVKPWFDFWVFGYESDMCFSVYFDLVFAGLVLE